MGSPENVHRTHISRFRDLCGSGGQTGHAIGFPYFLLICETNHDPLSSLPYPLGPNVNRWAVPENVHRTHISRFRDLCGPGGQTGHAIGFPYFLPIFETIHDPLSSLPYPLGPNVNRWAALKTSREPTFSLNVTCVGQVGRLGMPLASLIFC